jgi:hypothetical protein
MGAQGVQGNFGLEPVASDQHSCRCQVTKAIQMFDCRKEFTTHLRGQLTYSVAVQPNLNDVTRTSSQLFGDTVKCGVRPPFSFGAKKRRYRVHVVLFAADLDRVPVRKLNIECGRRFIDRHAKMRLIEGNVNRSMELSRVGITSAPIGPCVHLTLISPDPAWHLRREVSVDQTAQDG